MIEFSEDLTKLYTGLDAVVQRATFRFSVRTGEVPYYSKAFDYNEFTYDNPHLAVRRVLRDFDCSIQIEGDRVLVADVSIEV